LERFLTQPFFATEHFSGIKGKIVSIKDSLDGCERILRDEFKDYPESALYMIGAIDEAQEKVKAGKPVDKATPDSKAGAKNDPKPVAGTKPQPEQQAKPEPKPKPEAEHAAANAHES
jgi:F-type H+-transporting ATPase subunit beta